jgi:hypothetical protein
MRFFGHGHLLRRRVVAEIDARDEGWRCIGFFVKLLTRNIRPVARESPWKPSM